MSFFAEERNGLHVSEGWAGSCACANCACDLAAAPIGYAATWGNREAARSGGMIDVVKGVLCCACALELWLELGKLLDKSA